MPWSNTDVTAEANTSTRLVSLDRAADAERSDQLAVAPAIRPGIPSIVLTVGRVG